MRGEDKNKKRVTKRSKKGTNKKTKKQKEILSKL